MKVLVLGLPRTGTQSLADALTELGVLPIYHMREVGKSGHAQLWIQALEAKYEGQGDGWERQQFEQILAGYQGVADFPAALFPEELIKAYPEAAIILTSRSEDSWCESMMSTLWHAHSNSKANPDAPMTIMRMKYHMHCWGNDFPNQGREHFRKHNDLVRSLGQGREFLEFDAKTGWSPLREFLGLPAVDEAKPFPRSDDWAEYKKMVQEQKQAQS
ncbi:hypothetical protein N0V93_007080 [Gnomoniopsis smithogilvyi]|uniref:Sulfotransferase family protein n=1 Tax=Gnomoniopsis smithogilvyi TaxID=1191159 RepID=A0A9W8YQM3_9PEZI|nr:hypothetical protein N0V93_007080 [Gnomoniopsis smithogilvyi]